jgi:hypothetical protein|tara:strand:+ start:447 stop:1862 length:1416 start_codon:yes stop_codon:yes gene_type:complete
MSHLELNISEYAHKDLLGLFGISNPHLDNIQEKYRAKMAKVGQMEDETLKKNLESFFNQAYNTILDKTNEEKRISHIPLPEKSNTATSHAVIEIEEQNATPTFPLKYPLGNVNPVKRKTTTQLISLDTIFRDISMYPKSTDFVINLPNPIENVISMKLISAEIPNSFPLYSESQGNNTFTIQMYNSKDANGVPQNALTPLVITILDGSPTFKTLRDYINQFLDSQRNGYSLLKCGVDSISGRFFFRFKTLNEMLSWSAAYYSASGKLNPPDNKPPATFNMPTAYNQGFSTNGSFQHDSWESTLKNVCYKINFNPNNQQLIKSLGWALGFRYQNIPIITFNDKSPTQRGYIEYCGYYQGNTPYSDAESDYMFLYVDDFVGNYNDNLSSTLSDNNFFSKSLLARMIVSVNFYAVGFTRPNSNILEKTREYFGPVNIKKLHIKLIDKFGDLVDMPNSNYSFTLQFEKLYSSIRN